MARGAVRRQRRQDELRAEILANARELFATKGYEAFSIRTLATKIDCSPATIYLHFTDKYELFEYLVEDSFEQLSAALRKLDLDRGDPLQLLKQGARIYVDFGLSNRTAYEFAFILRPTIRRATRWKPHAAFQILRDLVKRCIAEHRFGPLDVELTSQGLWAAIHGVTALLITRPSFPWVDRNALIARVVDSAIDSLEVSP